ncbi:MAG: rane protein [Candidatus Saccharibacteria bacterium]|nr:rane protein [Candidatus Saccharibacteria bacterium]
MKYRLKNFIAAFALTLMTLLSPMSVAALSAPNGTIVASLKQDACAGLSSVDATQGCGDTADKSVNTLVQTVVNLLSLVVGIIAVIAIILAGLKYVTSGGDGNKVSSAKTTLIFALVGLVIVAFAQFLVRYVFNTAAQGVTPSP